ncbi:MAG: AAA family ATPase [Candidatus Woesearchaeota archaeon]|jgi:cell division control protein 6|nr:AAA family ATPase [Candidatus Woesearchaeota archaeon]MDP7182001.1 AAA family ATPase [Candidatus Woesearchaeota archaeon]MDP7198947.1 AAA family ATPase [Candidatus Woesearchaeota archaeon]MDP7467327.1 AAA family ATPase [Candidatus Woesearchaeota archaeon]MDP7646619.1 AAA family ATPase [Candidatus Woesearchaeota archaeon]
MLFDDMLKADESLFKNEHALDPEWVPKLLPFRDHHQRAIADCIKPVLLGRNGRNAFVSGAPGIGKTAAARWVLRDLEESDHGEKVELFYLNCWQKNTTFKVYVEMCAQFGYAFTQNKKSEELFDIIKEKCNKRGAVFIFDEVDKAEDTDFIYSLLNDIFNKSLVLITNEPDWINTMEDRVKSRLLPETISFKAYTPEETKQILKQRLEFAFVPDAVTPESFDICCTAAGKVSDVRVGLHLLRQSGLIAEDESSKKVLPTHVEKAILKLPAFSPKKPEALEEDQKLVLEVIKAKEHGKIGDLFDAYKAKGGEGQYKTFQRRIDSLSRSGYISVEKVTNREGNTTMIRATKKLTDY